MNLTLYYGIWGGGIQLFYENKNLTFVHIHVTFSVLIFGFPDVTKQADNPNPVCQMFTKC